MDQFQSIQSGKGLLKDYYDPDTKTPVTDALRKRNEKNSAKIKIEDLLKEPE